MNSQAFTLPPIPIHLADFPTIGGLVVPFTTLQHRNGKAALGSTDPRRMEQCLRERRCGVCAQVVDDRIVFLMRHVDLLFKCSVEPSLCPPCAAYTQQACPVVTGFMVHYRQTIAPFIERRCDDPECDCRTWLSPSHQTGRLTAPTDQWYTLWTRQYELIRSPSGRLAAGFPSLRVLTIRAVPRLQGGD